MACLSCSTPKKVIKGISAIITGAYKAIARPRLEICKDCPFNFVGMCQQCGCVIRIKVRVKEETCPIGKW